MKTAITNWSFHREIMGGRMDIAGFLSEAKRLDYKAVELLAAWTNTPEQMKEARSRADDLGLKVCCYDVSNNFCVTGSDLDSQIADVKKGIEAALQLGARVIRVFSGSQKKGLAFEAARGMIVEAFYRIAPEAEAAGITMAMENHGRLAATSEQVMRIIKSVGSPALKSTLDTGNFTIGDEDPVVAARNLATLVAHVHVKDISWDNVQGEPPQVFVSNTGRKVRPEVIGEGQIDFAKIFRILKNAGFNGHLSLEYEGNDPEPDGVARSTANLIKLAEA
ncbi:MAG: sugar phosphate isomerase/epimerase family protein [Armatimonadota bacterium]|nr:sugar phosphate isomerase/epimerase family protein [Armatimonadota bacterium]